MRGDSFVSEVLRLATEDSDTDTIVSTMGSSLAVAVPWLSLDVDLVEVVALVPNNR